MRKQLIALCSIFMMGTCLQAQVEERQRPAEWTKLVKGGRFIDRFLPMPQGNLSKNVWGGANVLPRYIDNGIENQEWSFWGGNIKKGADNKYHLFVCGWKEDSPKGHMAWPNSIVFNAVSNNSIGPFVIADTIGKGHNPEVYQLKDGRYVLYVINGRYIANDINGPWKKSTFDFDPRDRRIIEGLSNLTFAQREDGSLLMVCRGGGVWISQDGESCYNQITDRRVYPPVKGEFEDPVVWKDHIQYHLIVNDWLGRIAFYLRSKDGVNWVTDPGEAYTPGIAIHQDGTKEEWFKYERIKMFQDQYGRAIQANFAVIDTIKWDDKPNDRHSSKNISIPLNPGVLLTILDKKPITENTKTIRVQISAEEGFNPQSDIDLSSLRFGASEEVNYGRGCKVVDTKKTGKDLIVTFDATGSGITEREFAPKMIGSYKNGKLLYGYARLPYIDYIEPILSPRAPKFTAASNGLNGTVEVENFGQVASKKATMNIAYSTSNGTQKVATVEVPALKPYEKRNVTFTCNDLFETNKEYNFIINIDIVKGPSSKQELKATPKK